MNQMIRKIISSIPVEIVVILLIIAVPAIGVTVLSNKVSKNFTNQVAQSSPTPSPVESVSPSSESITSSLLKSPKTRVLGESTDNSNTSPIVTTPRTYRILSLQELGNMNGANSETIKAAQSAYNIFLQTPNLIFLSPDEQIRLFTTIVTAEIQKAIDEEKKQLQAELDWYNQQLYNMQQSSTPTQNYIQSNYQPCLDQKVASINNNPYLSESMRLSRIEKAKQDCANQ